jgi:hypothetical protein
VDLTGTWISEVKAAGTISAPLINPPAAVNIDLVIRMSLTKAGGQLKGTFQICKLTTTSTPDPTTLAVTFTPAVIATLQTTFSETDFTAMVGAAVPTPTIEILSGEDAKGNAVNSDGDKNPGDTLSTSIAGGLIAFDAYVGLDIKTTLNSTLTNATTITGTTSFTTSGKVFGSNPPYVTSGTITVAPNSTSIPFTATKLAGDVLCPTVLTMF